LDKGLFFGFGGTASNEVVSGINIPLAGRLRVHLDLWELVGWAIWRKEAFSAAFGCEVEGREVAK
jgi:hypothetical protein